MAIIGVAEEASRTTTQNWKQQRSYVRTWLVESNIAKEDPLNVINASVGANSIPDLLDAYPTDAYALVQDRQAQQLDNDKGQKLWRVTVTYGSLFDEDPNYYLPNPLDRPTRVEYDTWTQQLAVQYDFDEEPIENSAGVPYDPPELADMAYPVIRLIKNLPTQDLSLLATLQMVTNSDSYLGFGEDQLLLRRYTVTRAQENGVLHYVHTFELAVKWDKWTKRLLDMGYQFYDDDEELRIARCGVERSPCPHPSKLDGEGRLLPEGDDPVFNEFRLYRQVALGSFLPSVP
jgi:hypothetical protein